LFVHIVDDDCKAKAKVKEEEEEEEEAFDDVLLLSTSRAKEEKEMSTIEGETKLREGLSVKVKPYRTETPFHHHHLISLFFYMYSTRTHVVGGSTPPGQFRSV
jgi:hypothetical protein